MKIKELLELNEYLCSKTDCSYYSPYLQELEEFISTRNYNALKSKCGCNMLVASSVVLRLLIDNFDEHLSRKHFVKDKDDRYRLNVGLLERNSKWYNQLLYYANRKIKEINRFW